MGRWEDEAARGFSVSPPLRVSPSGLSVIIVSWNVRYLLRRCLASVLKSWDLHLATYNLKPETWNLELIVVDNASGDGSASMVQQEFPQARLIANERNLGFTGGNNQGIAASTGRYLLLLNPDTEIVGDTLTTMLAYMEAHPQVGLLGPQLRYADGAIQSSRRRFPTLATAFIESTVLQGFFAKSQVLRRYYMQDTPDDVVQEVDWLVGAAMLVRREVVDQVGGLDEGFFMYSEELDWCKRIKFQVPSSKFQVPSSQATIPQAWKVVYLPTAQVIHYEGKSSEQALAIRHVHFHSSKVRYFRKHHGWWQAQVLRVFLLGTYLWQLFEESVKWLIGHKRDLRAQRVRVYWQVLRSGLKANL